MKGLSAFLAAATLTAAALIAGCTNDDKPTTTAPGPSKAISPSPSLPAKPPTYTMPANVCTAVNADAFADLVPSAPPKTTEKGRSEFGRTASSTCMVTLGTLDRALLVSVGVDLFADSFGAQGQYEGFRGLAFKDHRDARDVAGVGTAAYFSPTRTPGLIWSHGSATPTSASSWLRSTGQTRCPPTSTPG